MVKATGITTIQMIAQQWMTEMTEVNANLVGAASMQTYSDQRPILTACLDPVFGPGILTIGTDLTLSPTFNSSNRGVNHIMIIS